MFLVYIFFSWQLNLSGLIQSAAEIPPTSVMQVAMVASPFFFFFSSQIWLGLQPVHTMSLQLYHFYFRLMTLVATLRALCAHFMLCQNDAVLDRIFNLYQFQFDIEWAWKALLCVKITDSQVFKTIQSHHFILKKNVKALAWWSYHYHLSKFTCTIQFKIGEVFLNRPDGARLGLLVLNLV